MAWALRSSVLGSLHLLWGLGFEARCTSSMTPRWASGWSLSVQLWVFALILSLRCLESTLHTPSFPDSPLAPAGA